MIAMLARVSLSRLLRTRRARVSIIGWCLLALVSAVLAKTTGGRINSADYVLRGTFGFVVLPLLTYGIVSAAYGGVGLRQAVRGIVALGASPRRAVLSSVLVAVAASAAFGGIIGALLAIIAHGPGDPPVVSDLVSTFGIGLFGAAAYAAYFSAGSAIGKGAMRGFFLAVDFILGMPGGFGSIFTPRAHIRSLLGGQACFELSRRTSSVMLVMLLVIYFMLALRLGRRPR